MLNFEYNGIEVISTVEMVSVKYTDAKRDNRTRLERNVNVAVKFWGFAIDNCNLFVLAFIKSTLQYYMQCYWKRANKEGGKFEFEKALDSQDGFFGKQSLRFTARQKAEKRTLHISFHSGGTIINEIYLDGQEVMMLDIAIGKAINLLSPNSL